MLPSSLGRSVVVVVVTFVVVVVTSRGVSLWLSLCCVCDSKVKIQHIKYLACTILLYFTIMQVSILSATTRYATLMRTYVRTSLCVCILSRAYNTAGADSFVSTAEEETLLSRLTASSGGRDRAVDIDTVIRSSTSHL